MGLLRKIGNVVFHMFYKQIGPAEWVWLLDDESFPKFLAEIPEEAEMIVVGMKFKIEGPDGQNITCNDIAQVLEYRDHEFFASLTGYMVGHFFRKLEWYRDEPGNPYRKWERKRLWKELGYPEEPDPEFDAIKAQLQKDLQAARSSTRGSPCLYGKETVKSFRLRKM